MDHEFGFNSNIILGPRDANLPDCSIQHYLYKQLQSHDKNKTLYYDVERDLSLTASQICEGSIKLAKTLSQNGIKPGDVIATLCENSLDYVLPLLASFHLGATFFPLNPSYTMYELNDYLEICTPNVVFCTNGCKQTITKVKESKEFIKSVIVMNSVFYQNILKQTVSGTVQKDVTFPIERHNHDTALILLSSGTTGRPKGVELTFENMLHYTTHFLGQDFVNITPEDVVSLVVPCYHIYGLYILFNSLVTGSTVVALNKFQPGMFLKSIENYRVTKLFLVPPLAIFLVKSSLLRDYDLTSVKNICSASAPLRQEIYDQLSKKFNASVYQMYGATETCSMILIKTSSEKQVRSNILMPLEEIKIRHVTTKEILASNEIGEICVKGPNIMKGYYKNPIATKSSFDEHGFFLTGDIGYRDQNGNFHIVDRIKDMIKYKGFQISPTEIEEVLLRIKGVVEAAVIGVHHERAGEVPMALIVKADDADISANDITKFVSEQLTESKWLRGGVKFVQSIPRTSSGKILKKNLKEMYAQFY